MRGLNEKIGRKSKGIKITITYPIFAGSVNNNSFKISQGLKMIKDGDLPRWEKEWGKAIRSDCVVLIPFPK